MTDRVADHPVLPMFTARWSPRAFSDEPITEHQLQSLFEAARWAPSSMNAQPWRFAYALRGDEHWEQFLSTLVPGNRIWAQNAAALIFVISRTMTDNKGQTAPNGTHSFDAGAAWMSLALQAHNMGLITHGMAGFDGPLAHTVLNLPDDFHINAVIAVGYQGDKTTLSKPLQAREAQSSRRPIAASIFHGPMRN